jgi:hypothetical protein
MKSDLTAIMLISNLVILLLYWVAQTKLRVVLLCWLLTNAFAKTKWRRPSGASVGFHLHCHLIATKIRSRSPKSIAIFSSLFIRVSQATRLNPASTLLIP